MYKNVLYLILLCSFSLSYATNLEEDHQKALKALQELPLQEAKVEALSFLDKAKSENDQLSLVKAYYLLGYIHKGLEDYGDAVIYYLEGARFGESLNHPEVKKDLISIYKNLSNIMSKYSHYELTHKFINKGIAVAESTDNIDQVVSLLTNRIHELLNENKCEAVLAEINSLVTSYQIDSARLFSLKNKAGRAYQILGDLNKAMENYEFIITYGKGKNKEIYANALHNIGFINFENKNYPDAITAFDKAIEFKRQNRLNALLINSLNDAAETCNKLGEYDRAISYLHEAEALETNGAQNSDSHLIYKLLSESYKEKNDPVNALKYYSIYSQKLEEYIAEQKKIEELDKKYNIQLLTERYFDVLAANREKEQTVKYAAIGIGGVILIFLLIIFNIYYKQYRVKRSIKEEIRKIHMMDI